MQNSLYFYPIADQIIYVEEEETSFFCLVKDDYVVDPKLVKKQP
jgi:hypothetical protein